VGKITYRLRQQNRAGEDGYRKHFKKAMDVYEPESDEFLLSELIFKELFEANDKVAELTDHHPETVFSITDMLYCCRSKPQDDKQFGMFVEKFHLEEKEELLKHKDLWLRIIRNCHKEFPSKRDALYQGHIIKGKNG